MLCIKDVTSIVSMQRDPRAAVLAALREDAMHSLRSRLVNRGCATRVLPRVRDISPARAPNDPAATTE